MKLSKDFLVTGLLTVIVAACSIIYELVYSQALTVLYGGPVARYSITIGLYLISLGLGSFFFSHGLNNWLPAILQDHGMSAARAGFWASVPVLVGIASALTIPRLAIPSRRLWVLAVLYVAAGFSAFLLHSSAEPALFGGLFLQGATRQTMMTIAMLILMETRGVDPRHMGAAGGLFFSAAEIGGVLGPLSIGWLADMTGGFDAALSFLVGVAAFLFLLLIPLRAEMRKRAAV